MPTPGVVRRIARMESAKTDAPWSGRSSRATDVSTANFSPICLTACATRSGS